MRTSVITVGLLISLAALLGSASAVAQTRDQRERAAKLLFVKASSLTRSQFCVNLIAAKRKPGAIYTADLVAVHRQLASILTAMDEERFLEYMKCLHLRRQAAALYDRILSDFADTEAAFEVAKQGRESAAFVDRIIEIAKTGRQNAEAYLRFYGSFLSEVQPR